MVRISLKQSMISVKSLRCEDHLRHYHQDTLPKFMPFCMLTCCIQSYYVTFMKVFSLFFQDASNKYFLGYHEIQHVISNNFYFRSLIMCLRYVEIMYVVTLYSQQNDTNSNNRSSFHIAKSRTTYMRSLCANTTACRSYCQLPQNPYVMLSL